MSKSSAPSAFEASTSQQMINLFPGTNLKLRVPRARGLVTHKRQARSFRQDLMSSSQEFKELVIGSNYFENLLAMS